MQAADSEPPGPVTAPGGAVSQIQSAVQANLMAAPVRETVDHSAVADAVHVLSHCNFINTFVFPVLPCLACKCY